MKTKQSHELSIKCGKTTDSFENLKQLCKTKAKELSTTIQIDNESKVTVPFWTANFPELICVGVFYKNESGLVTYELDFSQSTL